MDSPLSFACCLTCITETRSWKRFSLQHRKQQKRKRNVIESALFYQCEKGGTPIKIESIYGIANKLNDLIWSVRFRLERYPVSDQYYRWDQVRLVKRKRHLVNLFQLDHICNDLCLFGPYSKTAGIRCWECETGKIWRQIQR